MRRSNPLALVFALATPFLIHEVAAQQPTPAQIVIQAATTASTPAAAAKTVAQENNSSSVQAALKALQQIKSANEETLKRQEATLQQLDELQKAAEQLKIFAKRG